MGILDEIESELYSGIKLAYSPKYFWLIGVLLASLASIISNTGLNLQKLLHVRNAHLSDEEKLQYYKYNLWRMGLLLVIAGSIADVAALGFAPQSMIAPLGSLTLVSNTAFAPMLLKEKIGFQDILGTSLIVAGAIVAVSFGPHREVTYPIEDLFYFYTRPMFIAYAMFISLFMTGLYASILKLERMEVAPAGSHDSIKYHRDPKYRKWHRFAYAAVSGTVGAQSVLFAKCTVELVSNSASGKDLMFVHWQTYFVVACMFSTVYLQITWLNSGLRRFDSAYTVPVFQSFWIVVSVVSGMVYYREYHTMSWYDLGLFAIGVLITISGVLVLSQRENTPSEHNSKVIDDLEQEKEQAYATEQEKESHSTPLLG